MQNTTGKSICLRHDHVNSCVRYGYAACYCDVRLYILESQFGQLVLSQNSVPDRASTFMKQCARLGRNKKKLSELVSSFTIFFLVMSTCLLTRLT